MPMYRVTYNDGKVSTILAKNRDDARLVALTERRRKEGKTPGVQAVDDRKREHHAIEPIIRRNAEGHLIQQDCGICGRGIEKTPTGWRHI